MDRQVCFECSKTVTVTGKKKLRWDRHGCNCVPVTVTVYEGLVAARDINMRVSSSQNCDQSVLRGEGAILIQTPWTLS